MALLGEGWDDPKSGAIMALSAGLLGRNFAGGLLGAQNAYAQAKQAQTRAAFDELRMQQVRAQMADQELQANERKQGIEAQRAMRAMIPSLYRPDGSFDAQRAVAIGMDPKTAGEYAGVQNLGKPKATRQVEMDDGQGGKRVALVDDFGREVAGFSGYTPPVQVNQGDRVTFVRPGAGVSLPVGMSPSERDASARGWASNKIAQERLAMDKNQAGNGYTFNAEMGGYIPKQPGGAFVPLGGLPGGAAKLTEAEGKNTLYLSQMRDASNALDKIGSVSPAMVAATGSMATNWMAGADAQKAGQAQRQWAEAYLRAKTGAAATAGEVDNNVRTFFPVVGDSPAVIKQKADARAQAEKDMEIPSGRGAAKAVQRNPPASTQPDIDALLKKYGGGG